MSLLCLSIDLELRKLVGPGLWQTGFHADWMYGREEGGEEGRSFSSRDLLLALGWLLAAGTLEKLLTQRVQQLDKAVLAPLPVSNTLILPQSSKPNAVFTCCYDLTFLSLTFVSVSDESSGLSETLFRPRVSAEASVAQRPSETPVEDSAVNARGAISVTSLGEKISCCPHFYAKY